jgi:DNA-binding NtrC family response regulator
MVTVGSSSLHELIEEKAAKMMSLDEMEKHYISLILHKTAGKKERASQVLGIDRKTLRRKIRDYGLVIDGEVPSADDVETALN